MNWIDLDFFKSSVFNKIADFLANERRYGKIILPDRRQILRALDLTPIDNVKIVILGQDPYPTKNHAMGLAFSVRPGVYPLPKSLINIYKELEDDLGIIRKCGDLSDWAEQGVLLLNTTLTVEAGNPRSHQNIGWGSLTNEIIKHLSEHKENIVYILWGKHAQAKEIYLNPLNNKIIKSSHPSPLSAYRGFFGSKPFSTANKYLDYNGITPINW